MSKRKPSFQKNAGIEFQGKKSKLGAKNLQIGDNHYYPSISQDHDVNATMSLDHKDIYRKVMICVQMLREKGEELPCKEFFRKNLDLIMSQTRNSAKIAQVLTDQGVLKLADVIKLEKETLDKDKYNIIYHKAIDLKKLEELIGALHESENLHVLKTIDKMTVVGKHWQFLRDLMDFVIVSGLPPKLIAHPQFRAFVHNLDSRMQLPNEKDLAEQICAENDTIKAATSKQLARVKDGTLHLTFHLANLNNGSYGVRVIVHFIDETWSLNCLTVAFEKVKLRKKGFALKTLLTNLQQTYNIVPEKVGFVMVDYPADNLGILSPQEVFFDDKHARIVIEATGKTKVDSVVFDSVDSREYGFLNEINAPETNCISIMSSITEWVPKDLDTLECTTHVLLTVVKKCVQSNSGCIETLGSIARLVEFFSGSNFWHGKLVAATDTNFVPFGEPQWSSVLHALECFQKEDFVENLKRILTKITSDGVLTKDILETLFDTKKSKILEISKLVTPFFDLIRYLEMTCVASSLVFSNFVRLYKDIQEQKCTSEWTKKLQQELCHSLLEVCGLDQAHSKGILQNKMYMLAAVLDPRLKLSRFREDDEDDHNLQYLPSKAKVTKILMKAYNLAKTDLNENRTTERGNKASRKGLDFSKHRESDLDEVTEYLMEPVEYEYSDPLDYYKSKDFRFPVIKRLAAKYLSAPAVSPACRRMHSLSGSLRPSRRGRMSAKSIENVLIYRESRNRKPTLEVID